MHDISLKFYKYPSKHLQKCGVTLICDSFILRLHGLQEVRTAWKHGQIFLETMDVKSGNGGEAKDAEKSPISAEQNPGSEPKMSRIRVVFLAVCVALSKYI